MKLVPVRSGRAEFLKTFKETLANTCIVSRRDPKRLYNLRCSGLPYCPTKIVLGYGKKGMFESIEMMSAYYFGVGHAVHKVVQDYLSHSGQFIADYSCRECGTKYPLSKTHECCGFPTDYEEVGIHYKGIIGHIDGIFVDSLKRVWIIDYKTCTLKGAPLKEKNPGSTYSMQVRAYAYLLWKQYGIKVHGCMLIFLPRDNPTEPKIWEHRMTEREYEKVRIEILESKRLQALTMKCNSLDEFKVLMKSRCSDTYCDYCKKSDTDLTKLFTKFMKTGCYPIVKKEK